MWTEREGHIHRRAFASGGGTPARSETPCTSGNSLRENRETSAALCRLAAGRWGEGARTPHAYVAEESDWAVVPAKGPNKSGGPPAEDLEGRAWAEENVSWARHGPHTEAGKP